MAEELISDGSVAPVTLNGQKRFSAVGVSEPVAQIVRKTPNEAASVSMFANGRLYTIVESEDLSRGNTYFIRAITRLLRHVGSAEEDR